MLTMYIRAVLGTCTCIPLLEAGPGAEIIQQLSIVPFRVRCLDEV